MVNIKSERLGGEFQHEDAGDASVESIFRRNKLCTGLVVHGVDGHRPVGHFVNLRNHVCERNGLKRFDVVFHGFVSHLFSNLAAQIGVFFPVQVPVTRWEVKPRR